MKMLKFVAKAIPFAAVLVLTFIVASSRAKNPQQDELTELKVDNSRVPRLVVAGWQRFIDSGFDLKLRNDYEKPITAFQYKTRETKAGEEEVTSSVDLTYPGGNMNAINPGGEYSRRIGVERGETFYILDVVFDDGTYEGDPKFAEWIKGRRLGLKKQYRRINRLLRKAAAAGNTSQNIDDLKSQIAALPGDSKVPYVDSGLRDAKQSILHDLEELRQKREQGLSFTAVEDKLGRIAEKYKKHLDLLVELEARQAGSIR